MTERERIDYDDIKKMAVEDVIGMKVLYLSERTGRWKNAEILGVHKTKTMVVNLKNIVMFVPWDYVAYRD